MGWTRDRVEIGDLVARYVEAVANRELFQSVWAADANWVLDTRGTFEGPEAITAMFWRLRERQEFAVQRVVSGRAHVHDGGATAVGRWVIHSITRTNGQGQELVGVYDDRYVREGTGWKFRERSFSPLYRGAHDLPGRVFPAPSLEALEGIDA
jgi:hypothetical protein